ncbi:hypothetical protein L914_12759 [Phytophthora nicotianae]|uniref:Uncharacterized protein n=1 Tax=Phytophthora nicotianae TaxID=4792 RepID=W2MYV0_PHYNI|nr:hypothetical protein L914_12759 [Phytophthora nicotianae]
MHGSESVLSHMLHSVAQYLVVFRLPESLILRGSLMGYNEKVSLPFALLQQGGI